jgi:hypothetical protein
VVLKEAQEQIENQAAAAKLLIYQADGMPQAGGKSN